MPSLQHRLPILRTAACLALMALLSACATSGPQVNAVQEAHQYAQRAKHNYTPPGPPEDPWGPYISEASKKYDVPELWVRAVMHQESGGLLYENGQLIISTAGAMGLMQVMPSTYDGLRQRYALGDDPYDPHDNIMAGVAYMREMYEIYGTPGSICAPTPPPPRRWGGGWCSPSTSGGGPPPKRAPVEVAAMPEPPRYGGRKTQTYAMA